MTSRKHAIDSHRVEWGKPKARIQAQRCFSSTNQVLCFPQVQRGWDKSSNCMHLGVPCPRASNLLPKESDEEHKKQAVCSENSSALHPSASAITHRNRAAPHLTTVRPLLLCILPLTNRQTRCPISVIHLTNKSPSCQLRYHPCRSRSRPFLQA